MSLKRPRDDDLYRSKEMSKRKNERSYHHETHEKKYNKELDRNRDRNSDRNLGSNYRPNDERTNQRNSNYEQSRTRNMDRNNEKDYHKSFDRNNDNKSEKQRSSVPENEKNAVTDPPFVKEKVNFNKSGKLAQDTNMQNGVIVKYSEPIESANPTKNWRLYPFKNEESLPFIPLHRKSHYLLGRDRKVVDIPLDHPSVSKQHAVIQFRKIDLERKDGSKHCEIRPYLMDLESSNKTYLNNKEIDALKYYQLLEKDVIKFGFSSREYVVLIDHEDD